MTSKWIELSQSKWLFVFGGMNKRFTSCTCKKMYSFRSTSTTWRLAWPKIKWLSVHEHRWVNRKKRIKNQIEKRNEDGNEVPTKALKILSRSNWDDSKWSDDKITKKKPSENESIIGYVVHHIACGDTYAREDSIDRVDSLCWKLEFLWNSNNFVVNILMKQSAM